MGGTADPRGGDDAGAGESPALQRDRDAAGRARNARPRDALGRPLPYGSVDAGRQPEGIVRTPDETIEQAQRLLDAGRPFHAHEVFEDAWKSSTGPERALWKALAQLAVGLTHLARGNARGAKTLLQRGSAALAPYVMQPPFGIDVTGISVWATDLVTRIDAGGEPVETAGIAPRLRSAPLN